MSGLALASLLAADGADYGLFEARGRVGGRVLTALEPPRLVKDARGLSRELPGLALDCGPTWFWPAENPELARLVGALGLETFEQHEKGHLVLLSTADTAPRRVPARPAYATARRVAGGMGAIVTALKARLREERFHLEHELVRVSERDEFVELTFHSRGETLTVHARKVVLAMPPRLVEERLEFSPPLAPALCAALLATPTWMASQAKALVPFPEAFWRANGDSGAALSLLPDAVLGEVFDASDASSRPALGGFFALSPEERRAKADELPALVLNQLMTLFGPLPDGEPNPRIQDWAVERFTTAKIDLSDPALEPRGAPSIVREPHWNGMLSFAGTETGMRHPGHMEGALEAALGAFAQVTQKSPSSKRSQPGQSSIEDPIARLWLEGFQRAAEGHREQATLFYRDAIQRALSSQTSEGSTQRALLEAAASVYRKALKELASAPFVGSLEPSKLDQYVRAVVGSFSNFHQDLVAWDLRFNQTSCAIRAFADEARPDGEYQSVIDSDLQALGREFRRQVERIVRGG